MQGNFNSLTSFIRMSARCKGWLARVRHRIAHATRLQAWFRTIMYKRVFLLKRERIVWVQRAVKAKWEVRQRRAYNKAALILQRHGRRKGAGRRVMKLLGNYNELAQQMIQDKTPEASGLFHATDLYTHEARHRKIAQIGALRAYQEMLYEARLLFVKFATKNNNPKEAFLLGRKSLTALLKGMQIDQLSFQFECVKAGMELSEKKVHGSAGLSMTGWVELLGRLAAELYPNETDLAGRLRQIFKHHLRPLVVSMTEAIPEDEW